MRNRALQSRINARQPKLSKPKKVRTDPVPRYTLMRVDPVTGEILGSFADADMAADHLSINKLNILRAVKYGTKYKNAFWKTVA